MSVIGRSISAEPESKLLRPSVMCSILPPHMLEARHDLPDGHRRDSHCSIAGIFNVPGTWMKQAERNQGTALAGFVVRATTGYFMIGLSAAPADKERNIPLFKELNWIDIPIVYTNNRRAILSMEKGTPGEQAFQQAFAAWNE